MNPEAQNQSLLLQRRLDSADENVDDSDASARNVHNYDSGTERVADATKKQMISGDDDIVVVVTASSTFLNSIYASSSNSPADDGTVVYENKLTANDKFNRDTKFLKVVGCIVMVFALGIASFLVYFFLQHQLRTELKLKQVGFAYTKDMTNGWLFDASRDTKGESHTRYTSFELAKEGLGANEVDCAKKCASSNAFAGAWNTDYLECWCFLDVPNSNYCFEPCVREQGIEFSSIPLESSFSYCPESYCQIFEAANYCEYRQFNESDCLP